MASLSPSSAEGSAGTSRWRHVPRQTGALTTALGLAVIVGWHADWTTIFRVRPHLAAMQYNTAVGLVLCGLGLVWLTLQRPSAARWFGALAALLGLLTLGEYLFGRGIGIDEFFFKTPLRPRTVFPGRMSPLTAGCFVFIGAALALGGGGRSTKGRLTLAGVLACSAAVVALMVLLGYVAGIDTAHGWRGYIRMAVLTAVGFWFLGTGLLLWAMQEAKRENARLVQWLPLTASLTLMAIVAFLSIVNFNQMNEAARQHQDAYEALQGLGKGPAEPDGLRIESPGRLEAEIQSNMRLLRFGRLLVAGILLTALWMANRELNRRRQAEAQNLKLIAELQASLAEVKTLSGLIPICGWCKSVRSDKGYWQSVEQYVRTQTGATFTHGLCPTCADKMKSEIRTANPKEGTPPASI